ncbi:MAG TPA: hypothetical protein VFB95_04025 [Candidatus Cryosericum sp.]|nr:hypothetical protein [Candidatus Cryosericum sp.]
MKPSLSAVFGLVLLIGLFYPPERAGARPMETHARTPAIGTAWTVLVVKDPAALRPMEAGWERRVQWDLRGIDTRGAASVRRSILDPAAAGLATIAATTGADRALCASGGSPGDRLEGCRLFRESEAGPAGPRVLWSSLPGDPRGPRAESGSPPPGSRLAAGDRYTARSWSSGRGPTGTGADDLDLRKTEAEVVAEGIALLPAGPREVILLRETIREAGASPRLRYRFLTRSGFEAAVLEGPRPSAAGGYFPDRAELLMEAPAAVDDGIVISYATLSKSLLPGATGFLQYSLAQDAVLDTIHPGWTSVAAMIAPDAASVWDFASIDPLALEIRTFNSTRGDLLGSSCLESCAVRDQGLAPADGTWQAWLKIDHYAPSGSYLTRDVFLLNDNDTGANPSIDVPYLAQDELNTDDHTQICLQQSAGGAQRLLRFFRFAGADPSSAMLRLGDTWTSGAWTNCTDAAGLRLTLASACGDQCYPGCSSVSPRARGMLASSAGFAATIVEDGFLHVAAGNYVPSLLLRQDTDLQAGRSLLGICNLGTVRNRFFDYFWVQERYGLMALVSSTTDATGTLPPGDWASAGNLTDRVDVTWGPFPPYQMEARACLGGTRIGWSLPADGSNLEDAPGIGDWGYVVSWGSDTDPESLADWTTNPNHTPLPGEAGYLLAPPGAEPTSAIITTWPGPAMQATVVSALRYTDPGAGDVRAYRSAAFFKVVADPARLDPGAFAVGPGVDPFVTLSGNDVVLSWPAVPGASSYRLRVWDLETRQEIPCPTGLDCAPVSPAALHAGGRTASQSFAYRVFAVDTCGGVSAD